MHDGRVDWQQSLQVLFRRPALADAEADLLSMWGALTKPGPTISVLQGIREKAGSAIQVGYAHGPNLFRDIPSPFEGIPMTSATKEQPVQTAQEVQQAIE